MRNEFKYIPYDRKDTNIRGLIKNGNVYNLTRSMSGLLLPDDPNEEQSRAEKDWAYRKCIRNGYGVSVQWWKKNVIN